MDDFKDKMIRDAESEPDNWVTKRCCQCKEPVKVMISNEAVMNGEEPVWCDDCHPNRPD